LELDLKTSTNYDALKQSITLRNAKTSHNAKRSKNENKDFFVMSPFKEKKQEISPIA
jgi:hypothetical protein